MLISSPLLSSSLLDVLNQYPFIPQARAFI